jgi:IclR family pca regulon transcriptional regulator
VGTSRVGTSPATVFPKVHIPETIGVVTTEGADRPVQDNNSSADKVNLAFIEEDVPARRLSYSLRRGIKLLLACPEGSKLLGVAELDDLAGFSRPTAHRCAATLVQLGYLEQGRARKYGLAPRATDPGAEMIRELRHSLPADGPLRDLRAKIGYTVSMGALDRTRILYVHRFFGHRRGQHMIDLSLRVGAVIPAYCTALGKVMLANLPEDERRALIARMDLIPEGPHSITEHDTLLALLNDIDPQAPLVSDEEFVPGVRSIAMPIARQGRAQPIAIEVTVPSDAYTAAQLLDKIGPKLVRTAKLIAGP